MPILSLQSANVGLAKWMTTTWSPLMALAGGQLRSVCLVGGVEDEDTDLRRIRDTANTTPATNVVNPALNKELFPAVALTRDPSIETYTHTQLDRNFHVGLAEGKKFNYTPVLLKYSARVYCTTYELAEEFVARLFLHWRPAFKFSYLVGSTDLDPLNGVAVVDKDAIRIVAPRKSDNEKSGPKCVVRIPLTSRVVLVDEPVESKKILTAIADVYAMDGKVHSSDNTSLLETITVPKP